MLKVSARSVMIERRSGEDKLLGRVQKKIIQHLGMEKKRRPVVIPDNFHEIIGEEKSVVSQSLQGLQRRGYPIKIGRNERIKEAILERLKPEKGKETLIPHGFYKTIDEKPNYLPRAIRELREEGYVFRKGGKVWERPETLDVSSRLIPAVLRHKLESAGIKSITAKKREPEIPKEDIEMTKHHLQGLFHNPDRKVREKAAADLIMLSRGEEAKKIIERYKKEIQKD